MCHHDRKLIIEFCQIIIILEPHIAKHMFVLSISTRIQILCFCLLQMLDVSLPFEQATAEQIRLAQMISDHNDADFEEKVKQVSRCTCFCPT